MNDKKTEPGGREIEPTTLPDTAKAIDPEVVRKDSHKLYPLDLSKPQAIVVHCGDPRFQPAFRRFLNEELGLRNYVPIIIGGGIHAFGLQTLLPKNFKILWEQLKFFMRQMSLKQIIFINHENCLWYEKMKGYHAGIEPRTKGIFDLSTAASSILRDFTGISVRTFWAGIENDQVYFSEVTTK